MKNYQTLLIRDIVFQRCNRQFGCETIHPTEKNNFNEFFANVLRDNMTSEVVEAARGQKHHISAHTLAL